MAFGRIAEKAARRPTRVPPLLYSFCELMIGLGAVVVPVLLVFGRQPLLDVQTTWGSPGFTTMSGVCIALAMLPWTFCMGGTYPLAMAAFRDELSAGGRSFSFLHLANVVGATLGTLVPGIYELFGFFHPDVDRIVKLPRAHLVVDDGRRFLERTPERYDLIVVDPSPPVESVGTSLGANRMERHPGWVPYNFHGTRFQTY